jgi:hypothetical protein
LGAGRQVQQLCQIEESSFGALNVSFRSLTVADSAVECTKRDAWSYLQKPCGLERPLSALVDAYKRKVMNKLDIKEKRMNELLEISQYSRERSWRRSDS